MVQGLLLAAFGIDVLLSLLIELDVGTGVENLKV